MRVLIAVKGSEPESFLQQAVTLLGRDGLEMVLLAHVIDVGHRDGVEMGRERYLGRRHLGQARAETLWQAEQDRARVDLLQARQTLISAGVPERVVHEVILQGRPNEVLRELAERERVDVIVVSGRPGKPGPHSLGKTARFLVDHAPRAALLIRPPAASHSRQR